MKDIRLKEVPFELDGKTYLLRCNMNVLADVQEAVGGDLGNAMPGGKDLKNTLIWLAAMLNDYADEQGWPERFSAKDLGRRKLIRNLSPLVMNLVFDGLTIETEDEDAGNGEEKN